MTSQQAAVFAQFATTGARRAARRVAFFWREELSQDARELSTLAGMIALVPLFVALLLVLLPKA